MPPPAEPKDLKVKVGSPDEILWQGVLNVAKGKLKEAEDTIKINREVILMAGRKVKEAQRKFRKV